MVLRLLRGESLGEVSREIGVPVHRLEEWRTAFLVAGLEGLRARPDTAEGRELKEARSKIGELTMKIELLERALGKTDGRAPRRTSGR
ncbi:MAG: IS3 family transposase [Firmicutes bacterium]|nr:IS3 family transposase [Bacillota bacterium]